MRLHVKNSPFTEEQVDLLNRLLPLLTEAQNMWLSGYLTASYSGATGLTMPIAALHSNSATATVSPSQERELAAVTIAEEVTVLYGSQTGNAQRLAQAIGQRLVERGLPVTINAMSDFKARDLKKVKNLLILVSTHGEGIPPDNALTFYEFLHSRKAPRLEGMHYSVLALGDSSYEFFCQTGKDFDEKLEALGGQRLCPRVDCDLDYDDPAAQWMAEVEAALCETPIATKQIGPLEINQQGVIATVSREPLGGVVTAHPVYSRTEPFPATVLENLNLNGRGSDRETRHIELSLDGSNLSFEPGDCLGISPQNDPELVDQLIETMGWHSEELVPVNKQGEERPVREALLYHYEITLLTKPLLERTAQLIADHDQRQRQSQRLTQLIQPGNEQQVKEYIYERDVLDMVRDFSFEGVAASAMVPLLRKIPARLYSIASSYRANPEEAHLTIRKVNYHAHGRERHGVCSVQCAERIAPGDTLPVYIHANPNFKLPTNADAPVIMIGPGTGVAPFRAFLEDREETGASGKTWLFYGDRYFLTDFLYQTDWQKWLKQGVLTRMDVAFSRDTTQKVYVQHRLLEHRKDVYQWIQEGAHIYVCGDEKQMAGDVHHTLLSILQEEGGMNQQEATEYLTSMQQQKRYQRDVY